MMLERSEPITKMIIYKKIFLLWMFLSYTDEFYEKSDVSVFSPSLYKYPPFSAMNPP